MATCTCKTCMSWKLFHFQSHMMKNTEIQRCKWVNIIKLTEFKNKNIFIHNSECNKLTCEDIFCPYHSTIIIPSCWSSSLHFMMIAGQGQKPSTCPQTSSPITPCTIHTDWQVVKALVLRVYSVEFLFDVQMFWFHVLGSTYVSHHLKGRNYCLFAWFWQNCH